MFFCDRWLHYFHSEARLRSHGEESGMVNDHKVSFLGDKIIKFKYYKNKMKAPFAVYADIECLLELTNDPQKPQRHVPYSVDYYIKYSYSGDLCYYPEYRGADCAKWLVRELQSRAKDVETVHWCPVPIDKLTREQYAQYKHTTHCHICEKPLGTDRVPDHYHLTGQYRGAAHINCNLEYQDSKIIPMIFHNIINYDGHLMVEELAASGNLKVIPNNTKQYVAMVQTVEDSEVKFKFIDSLRFMASSLDKLTSYLNKYPLLESQFTNTLQLQRKGIFAYTYVSAWERLEEQQLPPIEVFHNDFTSTAINSEDYEHAQNVWRDFKCRNLGEYSDLYLKTDVLLLADVFKNLLHCTRTIVRRHAETHGGGTGNSPKRGHFDVLGERNSRGNDSVLFKVCKGQSNQTAGVPPFFLCNRPRTMA